jgi:hypothetical protein
MNKFKLPIFTLVIFTFDISNMLIANDHFNKKEKFKSQKCKIDVPQLKPENEKLNSVFINRLILGLAEGAEDNNTAIGDGAGAGITSGVGNTAIGKGTMVGTVTGSNNVVIGLDSGAKLTSGSSNVFVGAIAGGSVTTGSQNVAMGLDALGTNTEADDNVVLGYQALKAGTTATKNVIIGSGAAKASTTGNENVIIGNDAVEKGVLTGSKNIIIGKDAAKTSTTGKDNVIIGKGAVKKGILTGNENVVIGKDAARILATGSNNIIVGSKAGQKKLTAASKNNIIIGQRADCDSSGGNNEIVIGNNSSAKTFIKGIVGVTADIEDTVAVFIDSNDQLGTVNSARRYKENIVPMTTQGSSSTLEKLLRLIPSTFKYKNHSGNKKQFGLIAEEVEKVFPELVTYRKVEIEAVKYEQLSTILLAGLQELYGMYETQNKTLENQQHMYEEQKKELQDQKKEIKILNNTLVDALKKLEQYDKLNALLDRFSVDEFVAIKATIN